MSDGVRFRLAGILDSRGHMRVIPQMKGKGRPRALIAVTTQDREIIDWLLDHVGGSEYPPTETRTGTEQYRWRMTGQNASRLAKAMNKLLIVKRKREQSAACAALLRR